MSITDHQGMEQALLQAHSAQMAHEVPVGAVIIRRGQIIATGYNQVITLSDPSAHAEIQAIRAAGKHDHNYRLPDTTLVVTLEPCMMCLGAILHARIQRLVYGTPDPKTGALGGCCNLPKHYPANHTLSEILCLQSPPCAAILRDFFKAKRRT
jgi:tRNA(adenine34) deaminase